MGRGKPPAPALAISDRQYRVLEKASNKQTISHREKVRYNIILQASHGQSNSQISRNLSISLNNVKRWRRRWDSEWKSLNDYESGTVDKQVKDGELLLRMKEILSDRPRSGSPKRITMEQAKQIIAVACEKPEKYGIRMSQWNRDMLVKVVIEKGIVETISPRYVSVILKKK